MRAIFLAAALVMVFGCSPPPANKSKVANKPASSAQSVHWTYTSESDPMTDAKVRTACTTSLNEVNLSAPYHDVTARLCLRDKLPKKVSAFLELVPLHRDYDSLAVDG